MPFQSIGLPYFTAYPWRRAKTQLIFDLAQTEKQVVKELDKYVDVALPKGGVLADEMGLGKTMESKSFHGLIGTCSQLT